jgi:hypothetical protein
MKVWVGLGAAMAALGFGVAVAQTAGGAAAPEVAAPATKVLPPGGGAPAGGHAAGGTAPAPAGPVVSAPAPAPVAPPLGEPFLRKPASLGQVEALLTGLGYPVTEAADGQSFSINWTGKYDYVLQFSLSGDGALCYAYVLLATYTPGQMARLPMLRLLEQDDNGDFFYSAEPAGDGGEQLYGNAVIPLTGLTAGLLHGLLASMTAKMDAGDAAWNALLWH